MRTITNERNYSSNGKGIDKGSGEIKIKGLNIVKKFDWSWIINIIDSVYKNILSPIRFWMKQESFWEKR